MWFGADRTSSGHDSQGEWEFVEKLGPEKARYDSKSRPQTIFQAFHSFQIKSRGLMRGIIELDGFERPAHSHAFVFS